MAHDPSRVHGRCAAAASAPFWLAGPAPGAQATEIVHWSWLAASDGEVWQKMIDNFNEAHKDKGVQIRMELVPEEQYVTKVLAAAATGRAPDFGWGTAGLRAKMAKDGVIVPLDDLAKKVGPRPRRFQRVLDQAGALSEIRQRPVHGPHGPDEPAARGQHRPRQGGRARPGQIPRRTAPGLLEWAKAMTKRDGDKVTRSGIMMTGSGVQPTVTWGIVAAQMGFQRASRRSQDRRPSIPRPASPPCNGCSTCSTSRRSRTRDVTDRYKAFGTGQGSIFWTGPWTLNGYIQQKLNFRTYLFPKIGEKRVTYFEVGGLELYKQTDTGRYEATMQAVKWLSDNSFLWTTVGRGASPRKSILDRPDYKTAGHPWSVRGAFVDGMSLRHARRNPGRRRTRLHHLLGRQFPGQDAGERVGRPGPSRGRDGQDQAKWQKDLDAG